MDFNLPAQLDTRTLSEAGVPMVVRDASGAPLEVVKGEPVTLTLLGPDSDTYRGMTRRSVRARILRDAEKREATFAEDEAEIVNFVAACTIGWAGIVDKAGEPIPFSVDAAAALYRQYPVIRDQADAFIADRRRFMRAS